MVRRYRLIPAAVLILSGTLLVSPARAGGGCAHTSITKGRSATVEIVNACFTPTLVLVDPGQTLTFVNRDPFAHNVVGTGLEWGNFDELQQGDSLAVAFDRPGVYPFACYLHPGMVGAVIVGDANGPGAATRLGIPVLPVSTESPSTPTPAAEAAPALPSRTSSSPTGWWVAGVLALALAALAIRLCVAKRTGGVSASRSA